MLTIGESTPAVEKVIAISNNAVTLPVVQYAHDLEIAWRNRCADKAFDLYDRTCMISAAFLAGYMQGKREERAKQRQAAQADA